MAVPPSPSLENQPEGYPVPRLPLELLQYIVDFLWDDRDALQACTEIYPLNLKAEAMLANISKISLDWLKNEAEVENFTRDFLTSPTLPSYFSQLTVQVRDHSPSSWCYNVPLRFAPKLTRVERLTLLGVFNSHKTHFPLTTYFGLFRSVTTLFLENCTFPGFADFARSTISFPKLSTLNIRDVDWDQYLVLPHILGKTRTKKMCWKELGILSQRSARRHDYLHQFLGWLRTTPVPRSLRVLTVKICFPADFEVLTPFLKAAGDGLEHLRVYVVPGILHGSHIPDHMSLDSLSSLEELEFSDIGTQDLPAFLSVFSHVPRKIKKVTLQVQSRDPEDINHSNWDLLEDHLTKNGFMDAVLNLRFDIVGVEGGSADHTTKELLKRFPAMSAKTQDPSGL